jgi:hypothetical protein
MSKMADFKEHCVFIKFCFKGGGENTTETFEILKVVFGDQRVGRTQAF